MKAARGFTLIEILAALTLIGIAVVYLVQLFSANLRTVGTSRDYMEALTRAEAVMRGITERDRIEETSWQEETEQGYRVSVSVSEDEKERTEDLPVKLLRIEMTFSWESAARKKSLILRSLKVVDRIDNRNSVEQKS